MNVAVPVTHFKNTGDPPTTMMLLCSPTPILVLVEFRYCLPSVHLVYPSYEPRGCSPAVQAFVECRVWFSCTHVWAHRRDSLLLIVVCGMDTLAVPHPPPHNIFVCILDVFMGSRTLSVRKAFAQPLQCALICVLNHVVFPYQKSFLL